MSTPVTHKRGAASEFEQPAYKKARKDTAPTPLSNSSSTISSLGSSSSISSSSQSLRSASSAQVDLTNRAGENLLLSIPRHAGSAINPQGPLFAKPAPSGRKVDT